MRMGKAVALVAGLLLVLSSVAVSCGGDKEGGAQSDGHPGEEQLRATAQEAQRVFISGEPEEAYAFFSTDYKARCPLPDFTRLLMGSRSLSGISKDAEIAVTSVRFEDDKAFVDLTVNGQNLNVGAEAALYPYYWIAEDGQWKRTNDEPQPCAFPIGTPTAPGE